MYSSLDVAVRFCFCRSTSYARSRSINENFSGDSYEDGRIYDLVCTLLWASCFFFFLLSSSFFCLQLSLVHSLTKLHKSFESLVTRKPAFNISLKCVASSSSAWRPWLLPTMSSRGPFCNLGKEAMPSYRHRIPFSTAHTPFAEKTGVSTQAKHAARKDVSKPTNLGALLGHRHKQ